MESKKNIPKGDFKIGQRVKTLREGQSLTQKELADMVAISPSSIARLESGETMTSVSTLLKIAEALNTSISSIVASANENIQFQDEIAGLVANSHFLRPAGPHFPASQGHIKRSALEIGRARGAPPC